MSDSEKPKQLEVEELTECSECKSEHIVRDYKRGEITCRNCGLVVDDQVIDPVSYTHLTLPTIVSV